MPRLTQVVAELRADQELGRQVGDRRCTSRSASASARVRTQRWSRRSRTAWASAMYQSLRVATAGKQGLDVGEVVDDGAPERARIQARTEDFGRGAPPGSRAGAHDGARLPSRRPTFLRGHLACWRAGWHSARIGTSAAARSLPGRAEDMPADPRGALAATRMVMVRSPSPPPAPKPDRYPWPADNSRR